MTAQPASAGRLALRKVNRFRARHGLRPLRGSKALSRSARGYARLMMRRRFFGHGSRIHASGRFRSLAELIMMHRGAHARPGMAVSAWARSAAHRALLLNPAFNRIGIGKASGRFHGRRTTFWVAHVGLR